MENGAGAAETVSLNFGCKVRFICFQKTNDKDIEILININLWMDTQLNTNKGTFDNIRVDIPESKNYFVLFVIKMTIINKSFEICTPS